MTTELNTTFPEKMKASDFMLYLISHEAYIKTWVIAQKANSNFGGVVFVTPSSTPRATPELQAQDLTRLCDALNANPDEFGPSFGPQVLNIITKHVRMPKNFTHGAPFNTNFEPYRKFDLLVISPNGHLVPADDDAPWSVFELGDNYSSINPDGVEYFRIFWCRDKMDNVGNSIRGVVRNWQEYEPQLRQCLHTMRRFSDTQNIIKLRTWRAPNHPNAIFGITKEGNELTADTIMMYIITTLSPRPVEQFSDYVPDDHFFIYVWFVKRENRGLGPRNMCMTVINLLVQQAFDLNHDKVAIVLQPDLYDATVEPYWRSQGFQCVDKRKNYYRRLVSKKPPTVDEQLALAAQAFHTSEN